MKQTLLPALFATLTIGASAQSASPAVTARFTTQVPAIAFVPVDRLPANPSPTALSARCGHLMLSPATPGGRLARKLGWGVTAEISLDRRTAVSFVGSAKPATSGTCALDRGNIGIFEGGRIVALAHARSTAGRSIGALSPLPGRGARIWDDDLVRRPIGDLIRQAGGPVAIDKVAGEDQVCGGGAIVPNLYDQPIDRARMALRKAGWMQLTATGARSEQAVQLAAAGIPEAEDCAGTGFGFCSFAYRGRAGTLTVISVGDGPMPAVSGYRVACGPRRP